MAMNYNVNGTEFTQTGRQVTRPDGYRYTKWSWVTAAGVQPYRKATAAEARVLNARRAENPMVMSEVGTSAAVHPSYRV